MPALSAQDVDRFYEQGFLVVEDVVPPERLEAVLDDIGRIARRLAADHGAPSAEGSGWERELMSLVKSTGKEFGQHFDISYPVRGHVDEQTPVNLSRGNFEVMIEPRLLDAVESIVGPEVFSNPVQHLRIKLPEGTLSPEAGFLSAMVPWHQDNGVVLAEADETLLVTAWVAVTRATRENGCLRLIPRSHSSPILTHCLNVNQYEIPRHLVSQLGEPVDVEMNAGSVIFIHSRVVHASNHNVTEDEVRVSLDLRYQPTGEPTGRPWFPGFVARSKADPASALADYQTWVGLWKGAIPNLPDEFAPDDIFRWGPTGNVCA